LQCRAAEPQPKKVLTANRNVASLANGLKQLDKTRKALRQETYESLKAGRVYALDPTKTFQPKQKASSLAEEYGVVR